MGGAVATLVTNQLLHSLGKMRNSDTSRFLKCITFGAPLALTGNSADTANTNNQWSSNYINFVFEGDIVPRIFTILLQSELPGSIAAETHLKFANFMSNMIMSADPKKFQIDVGEINPLNIIKSPIKKVCGVYKPVGKYLELEDVTFSITELEGSCLMNLLENFSFTSVFDFITAHSMDATYFSRINKS